VTDFFELGDETSRSMKADKADWFNTCELLTEGLCGIDLDLLVICQQTAFRVSANS
jgi:hypothetical protein